MALSSVRVSAAQKLHAHSRCAEFNKGTICKSGGRVEGTGKACLPVLQALVCKGAGKEVREQ